MNETFTPLARKSDSTAVAEPFRLKIIPGANAVAQPFHALSRTQPSAPVPAPSNAVAHHGEPKVMLIRAGDCITHIRMQCGCGDVMELQCVY